MQSSIIALPNNSIVVRSLKYDGRIHRTWNAHLVTQFNHLIILEAVFEEEIRHQLLGTIVPGTLSTEYYWLNKWYNVFRFTESKASACIYYCNINLPAKFADNLMSYVDLDIDILVAPDFRYKILDEDEFETNAARFNYPVSVRNKAFKAVKEVIGLIEKRRFPFSNSL